MNYLELDTTLSDEAKAVQAMAWKFSKEVLRPIGTELDLLADPADVIAPESKLWDAFRQYRELGLHKNVIPKEFGGLAGEMDPKAGPLISEAFGYGDAGLAISLGVAGFPFRFAAMSPEPELQQMARDYVEDLDCEMIGCWAITEPDHGSDWLQGTDPKLHHEGVRPNVRAELVGDEYILNGQKAAWVSNGTIATHASLHVSLDPSKGMGGTGIAIMPLDLPGISRGKPLNKIGQRALNQGEIFFEEVKLPKKYMLVADANAGAPMVATILTGTTAGMGASFVGLAQAAYDEALKYAKERIQGGVPIIEHQNIKLKLFDMFSRVEYTRAYVRRLFQYMQTNPPGSLSHSIVSKIIGTETAFKVASEAITIFGGNGLSKEYPIEKLFRDARASMIEDGTSEALALEGARYL